MVLLSESLVSQAEDLIAAGDSVCRPLSLRWLESQTNRRSDQLGGIVGGCRLSLTTNLLCSLLRPERNTIQAFSAQTCKLNLLLFVPNASHIGA